MMLGQGAEAVVTKHGDTVLKERVAKAYRHPAIDASLRKSRTRREAKILEKLEALKFPAVRLHSADEKTMTLTLDFVHGKKLVDVLPKNHVALGREVGKKVGILHAHDIIHGDLTTSNLMLDKEVVFIDFGLSFVSKRAEDKAVDLHLLKQALESAHHDVFEETFAAVLAGYKEGNPHAKEVLAQFENVEKRGRNKK
jgi:Kae1-associated kinase Bud32